MTKIINDNKIKIKYLNCQISHQIITGGHSQDEEYSITWNHIKEHFSYDDLRAFATFRQLIVDHILSKIFEIYGCNSKEKNIECISIASGSTGPNANPKSDYDLTIINQTLNTSSMIKLFNEIIVTVFDQTPFEVFDTNLYGYSCIISNNNNNFLLTNIWSHHNNNLIKSDYFLPSKENDSKQDMWALRQLKKYMNKYSHIINVSVKIDLPELGDYIDKMEKFEKVLLDYTNEKTTNIIPSRKNDALDLMRDALSNMNYSGDETYFTIGAFKHVVGTMFYYRDVFSTDKIEEKKKICNNQFLIESDLIHSMIENLAYFLHSLDNNNNDLIVAIKYFERFINATVLLLNLTNITDDNCQNFLEMLSNVKQNLRNSPVANIIDFANTYNIPPPLIRITSIDIKQRLKYYKTEVNKLVFSTIFEFIEKVAVCSCNKKCDNDLTYIKTEFNKEKIFDTDNNNINYILETEFYIRVMLFILHKVLNLFENKTNIIMSYTEKEHLYYFDLKINTTQINTTQINNWM
jgi:hypothetical protein